MRKQMITIIILTTLIVILIVSLYLLWNQPLAEGLSAEPFSSNYELFRFDAPVVEARFDSPITGAPFTLASLPITNDEATHGIYISGHEELPINTARAGKILGSGLTLKASTLVYDDYGDYTSFGLANPRISVTLTDANGVSHTLLIGDAAPDGHSYYVQIKGNPALYLIPSFRLFYYMLPETGFVDTVVTSSTADALYQVKQIILGGTVREKYGDVTITMGSSPNENPTITTAHICSLIEHPLDYPDSANILLSILNLNASSVVAISPSDEELEIYGLLTPYAMALVNYSEGESIVLIASEPDEMNQIYLMKIGLPLLFRVQQSDVPWLDKQFYDLMSRSVFPLSLDDVDEIIIADHEQKYTFSLRYADSMNFEAYSNGNMIDKNKFMALCKSIKDVSFGDFTIDSPIEGSIPYLAVTYRYRSAKPDRTVVFYTAPSHKYFIEASYWDYHFYTSSYYVDAIVEQLYATLPRLSF